MRPESLPEIRAIKSKTDRDRETLHKIPGVTATGITHSMVTRIDAPKSEYQILVLIKDKSVLKHLPSHINGVRIVYSIIPDVPKPLRLIHSNYQSLDSNRYRPLKAGSEVTNLAATPSGGGCWVGTLGGFPYLPDGTRVILSNNHVIAHDNPGSRVGAVGNIIYQPGCQTESIGTLASWIPINSTGNTVDAAYARINSGIQLDDYSLCNYSIGSSITPVVGMSIIISGRTSGCTIATIEAVDIEAVIDYSEDPNTPATGTFTGQILTSPGFVSGGDSGSVAVTNGGNYNAIGLAYAGYDDGTAFLNPMSEVEQQLGVEFRNVGTTIPPASGQCDPILCPSTTNYCVSGNCIPKNYALIGAVGVGLFALAALS